MASLILERSDVENLGMQIRIISFLILWVVLMSCFTGCASGRLAPRPISSGRQGFFDHSSEAGFYQLGLLPRTYGMPTGFEWPLRKIEVTSPYGKRGHEFHE